MLATGDEALLAAPTSNFQFEINRIKVERVPFRAMPTTNSLASQTCEAELADLQGALTKGGLSQAEQERLLSEFQRVRQGLSTHSEAREQDLAREQAWPRGEPASPRPKLAPVQIPAGLPCEFADYLAGSIAYHAEDTNGARQAWQRLLQRPETERRNRSIWAAFMLGKTWLETNPEKAVACFEQVRQLANSGFGDSIGLAAASYGWQAKAEANRKRYAAAIRLYLAQLQTADPTALLSLRLTARQLLTPPQENLAEVAADPLAQQVVTAYIVSRWSLAGINSREEAAELIRIWLQAVENAGLAEVPAADALALAAYQHGLFSAAEHWLRHARGNSAMAQWLRAKLLLREGKTSEAARLLTQVVRLFPREGDWMSPPVRWLSPDSNRPGGSLIWVHRDEGSVIQWDTESPLRQAMGELGVLHLARGSYYEALDTLLRSGYWSDAAYVAEYVLTVDELFAYVERQWPEEEKASETGGVDSRERYEFEGTVRPDAIATELRYLLARRLARLQRWDEAVDFYPRNWGSRFQEFVANFRRGHDAGVPAQERGQALWEAAQIARKEGMELFGTEVDPDWHLVDGQYDLEHVSAIRERPTDETGSAVRPKRAQWDSGGAVPMKLAPSTRDEQRRLAESKTKPDLRFHYRYYAADLAWEAAQLMPDNASETARVLWRAGTWLKGRDPQAADRFYKALVRRCGQTALGAAADRLRWFPKSDTPEPPPVAAAPPTELMPETTIPDESEQLEDQTQPEPPDPE